MGCVQGYVAHTVREGEVYAMKDADGKVTILEGPKQVVKLMKTFEKLDLKVATESQYLLIQFNDGRSELKHGPVSMLPHPVEHKSVEVKDAERVSDQEVLVVYRPKSDTEVTRHLVRGPSMYIPQSASEWVHNFSWTGPADSSSSWDTDAPARKKVDALKFRKLRTIPGKLYFDVENVRTKDNTLITVKLMIFYKLLDVEQMLDATTDPIGDFVNAVSADVIEWTAPKKFDDFQANTEMLNTMAPYVQLQASCKKLGYEAENVVFRGYEAPAGLQRQHDIAIERRTQLTLASETEAEEQKLTDFRLNKEGQRAYRQHQLDMERQRSKLAMEQRRAEAEEEITLQEANVEIEHFANLKKLDWNFDVGKYVTARDNNCKTVVQCQTMQGGMVSMTELDGSIKGGGCLSCIS